MSKRSRIGVVGGGISGLSTAFFLQESVLEQGLDAEVTLLEKSPELGGVIRSVVADGCLLETGPEGWASYKPTAKKLVQAIGLQDQMIGSNDEHRRTLIVRNGRLTSLPEGMMFLAPVDALAFWRSAPLSLPGKLRASLEPLVPRSQGDLSVRRFFQRRMGREFTERLVEPLTSAIYGSDFEQLSAPSNLPELYRAEQRAGSLWRGLRRFAKLTTKVSVLMTMKGGMAQLTGSLEEHLADARILCGIRGLRLRTVGGDHVLSANGFEEAFDALIFCTPAHATAEIIEPEVPEVGPLLRSVPYASSTLIYLAYPKDQFDHPLDGFGFIVPRRESRAIDACTWVSTKFNYRCPPDRVLLRCAVHERPGRTLPEDSSLLEQVDRELRSIMGVTGRPSMIRIFRVQGGIPQLLVGHAARMARAQEILSRHHGLSLAGSYTRGVGVPDCIATAQDAASAVVNQLTG